MAHLGHLLAVGCILVSSCAKGNVDGESSNARALKILDSMLKNYDRRSTPTNSQGVATNVSLELYVASLGSINTENMDYVTDTYLRQRWFDHRLAHSDIKEPLDLADPLLVKAIWKPEVFFPNAKEASFQFVTVPNVLVRIHPNGEILYILRLRLKFSCMMELSRYPLDRQLCGMQIASFSKTTRELQLFWSQDQKAVSVSSELKMPQFTIEKVSSTVCNEQFHMGNYSCLVAQFHMKRSVSFHLIQSYLPSILIVAISWVSFWMDLDSVPGRISLGVITLLAVSSQAGREKNVPQTSYVKAIDVWMGLCTAFVFSALVEFTIVNFWYRKQKYGSSMIGELDQVNEEKGLFDEEVEMELKSETHCNTSDGVKYQLAATDEKAAPHISRIGARLTTHGVKIDTMPASPTQGVIIKGVEEKFAGNGTTPLHRPASNRRRCHFTTSLIPTGDGVFRSVLTSSTGQTLTKAHPAELIDQACRGLFPLGFLVCNILYWVYYLIIADEEMD